jgi:hypothetical protein
LLSSLSSSSRAAIDGRGAGAGGAVLSVERQMTMLVNDQKFRLKHTPDELIEAVSIPQALKLACDAASLSSR